MAERAAGSARELSLPQQEIDCRVHVFGYPPYTQPQDLTRAFVHFGNLRVLRMSAKNATLVFPTPCEAEIALQASEKVSIYGTLLTVKPFDPTMPTEHRPRRKAKKQQTSPTIDPKKIDLSGDVSQQLDRILRAVRLTQAQVAAIGQLYRDLEQALQALWPGCTAVPFGSIPTGLGTASSDADCFVRVPAGLRARAPGRVLAARRVLRQRPRVFADVLAIPRANTPIVKFLHAPTGTACDLSFKTELGAMNSRLVAFLLHADPRVLPLAVVLKYWARVHELSGSGKLTNYALTMLVVFYLQQPPLALLPSVRRLQAGVREQLVDRWNVAFDERRQSLPQVDDETSIWDLIGGFFLFYAAFNFDELIVCPYLGRAVEKKMFEDLNALPEEFERYCVNVSDEAVFPMRFNTSICVQDPFEQCHNVASTISSRLADEIKAYLKFAANAYEREKPTGCQKFFEIILLEKPKIAKCKGNPEFRANLFPNVIANIIAPDWKAVVRKIVLEIFETMLQIKLDKVEDKVNQDTKKEKEKYMGAITKTIWKRKHLQRNYSASNMDFVERNQKITEDILSKENDSVNINFQMTMTFCHEPRSAVVSIKMSSGDVEAYREFGKFFVSVLHNWFANMVKPFARCPGTDTATKIAETIRCVDSRDDGAEPGAGLAVL